MIQASTPIGSRLQERYVLDQILGRGGMGAVYLAKDERLDKAVAVKQLTVGYGDDISRHKIESQFYREAHLLASLRHPGLVSISDYFTQDESHFLVMEYVQGVTLDTLLSQWRGFPNPLHVTDWATQLCEVLLYLHSHSPPVIFRDLKPSNIMLDSDARIRLIDFGIARLFDPNTNTATIIRGAGTPGFAPLEQYGEGTDTRSDIYALGATLYAMLTRTLPPTAIQLVAGDDVLIPPSRLNPSVPDDLESVILRMMALRREDRYQSAAEVLRVLERLRSPQAVSDNETLPSVFGVRCGHCGTAVPDHLPACSRCFPSAPTVPVAAAKEGMDVHIFVHTDGEATGRETMRLQAPDDARTRRLARTRRRRPSRELWKAGAMGALGAVCCMLLILAVLLGLRPSEAAGPVDTGDSAAELVNVEVLSACSHGDSGVTYVLQDDVGRHYDVPAQAGLKLTVGDRYDSVIGRLHRGAPGRHAILTQVQLP